VGQAPAYASYIALGCGPKPISSGTSFDTYKEEFTNKDVLDFEMFRVPIISRGYVTDNGVNKVVLTAELPTEERYEISEVGIYSAGSNPSAGAYDSKMVFSFSQSENWEFHGSASLSQNIPTIQIPLDTLNGLVRDDIIVGSYKINSETKEYDALGTLTPLKAFQTNADNRVFMDSVKRNLRYEKSRMLNNLIMMSGSSGKLNASLVPQTGSSHIHLTGASLNFTKNSPSDLLKLAFSLINKIGGSDIQPDEVRILVEFSSTDEYNSGQWAKLKVKLVNGVDGNFATNRYFVSKSQLQDLTKSDGFSWDSVNTVKIYTTVIKDSVESEDYYIGLDALRLDNLSTINQLYGLTGYTIVRTDNAETIVKIPNTTNYVEFRFGMDVA
jgi:hypothetical protein